MCRLNDIKSAVQRLVNLYQYIALVLERTKMQFVWYARWN